MTGNSSTGCEVGGISHRGAFVGKPRAAAGEAARRETDDPRPADLRTSPVKPGQGGRPYTPSSFRATMTHETWNKCAAPGRAGNRNTLLAQITPNWQRNLEQPDKLLNYLRNH